MDNLYMSCVAKQPLIVLEMVSLQMSIENFIDTKKYIVMFLLEIMQVVHVLHQ